MSYLLFNTAEAETRNATNADIITQIVPRNSFGEGIPGILNDVFYAGLVVAVALALAMVIRGGVEYMTVDGGDAKGSAKKRIQAALGGLVLAFAAILILNTINPGLTELDLTFRPITGLDTQGAAATGSSTPTSGTRTDGTTGGSNSSFTSEEIKNYTQQKIKELGLDKLSPSDKAAFFPNGGTDAEWMALITAMMKEESGHNPSLTYTESFKDKNGNYVISTGLLQLSQESVRGYAAYNPALANITTEDLKNPQTNIDAGLTILKRLVERDGCISCSYKDSNGNTVYQGGAAYWSVLRPSGKLEEVKANMR